MNRKQISSVASIAATVAVHDVLPRMLEEMGKFVEAKVPVMLEQAVSPGEAPPVYERVRVVTPWKPASDFTQVLMESVHWRRGRGECLGTQWMVHKTGQKKLLIQQYGDGCSVLLMDLTNKKCQFDTGNSVVKYGASCWKKFWSLEGVLETVVAACKKNGWELAPPTMKQAQLTLVHAS